MKIIADTNVLVRAAVRDDAAQAQAAEKILQQATLIAISLPCLCEFVWVLRRVYGLSSSSIALAIRALLATGNAVMNRPAVEAGLAFLEAGGDFADGIVAYEGHWLGGETFVSFEKKAVSLASAQGLQAQLIS